MSLTVYNASAGSGKTYTLALKYLSLALANDNPNHFTHILAVTFTNKATAEMKDRILMQLYNLAHGGKDAGFLDLLMKETHQDRSTLVRRGAATLAAIMHDYDHFRVETIDSFFQSLLTNLAHELRLPRSFKVDLDDKGHVERAVEKLLLTLDNPDCKHSRNNASKLVTSYMERYIEDDRGWDVSKDLKQFARSNLFDANYMRKDDEIARFANYEKGIETLLKALRESMKQVEEVIRKDVAELQQTLLELGQELKISTLQTYCRDLLNGTLYTKEPSATVLKAIDDSDTLIKAADLKSGAYTDEARRISEVLETAEEHRKAYTWLYNSCLLVMQNLDGLRLIGTIGQEVNDIMGEEGTFLLAKTPELFNKMVQDTDSSFVFERTGTTFNHIMIDEFQDTSRMQWDNFKRLFGESLSQGEECMLVGDIKQSIYRWRGGDWDILYRIDGEFEHIDKRSLQRNFRSRRNVVKFNNAFFVKAATLLDDIDWNIPSDWMTTTDRLLTPALIAEADKHVDRTQSIAMTSIYREVEQDCPTVDEGYVRLSLADKDTTPEEVIEEMYEQMIQLHDEQQIPYSDMGVLVRYKSEASLIIDYLSACHPEFPITSDEAYRYTSSSMVMTLVYALKYLADTTDTVALELFRQTYCTLYKDLPDEFVRCQFEDRQHYFIESVDTEEKRQEWLNLPLYELYRRLLNYLNFSALEEGFDASAPALTNADNRFLKDGKQSAYLYNFADDIIAYLSDHTSSVSGFLKYWDEVLSTKSIATTAPDSACIMTIHKAKGLQMHTVLIPFCDFSLRGKNDEDYLWWMPDEVVRQDETLDRLFGAIPTLPIRMNAGATLEHSLFRMQYVKELRQQETDNLNTLYVAFTRAEANLIVWCRFPSKNYGSNVFMLVDAFVNEHGPGFAYSSSKKSKGTVFTASVTPYGRVVKGRSADPETASAPTDNPIPVPEGCNPFDNPPTHTYPVCLHKGALHNVKFYQSGEAEAFVADLADRTDKEPYASTDNSLAATAQKRASERQSYIDRGLLYHYLFSLINRRDDIDRAVVQMKREGLFASQDEADGARRMAVEALSNPAVQSWYEGDFELFNESGILMRTAKGTQLVRPDRVMVKGDECIVVDYKFGTPKNTYPDQVNKYKKALQALGMKQVKGYLWYVTSDRIEEV